jgi:hypothetical protein
MDTSRIVFPLPKVAKKAPIFEPEPQKTKLATYYSPQSKDSKEFVQSKESKKIEWASRILNGEDVQGSR